MAADSAVNWEPEGLISFPLPHRQWRWKPVKVPVSDDEKKLHRQLVCWCCLHRYWYYVLHEPKIPDTEYDMVENYVKNLEQEFSHLRGNPYSPVTAIGSSRPEDYPKLIRWLFFAARLVKHY